MLISCKAYLVLSNNKTGRIMFSAEIAEDELFSVSYTHSVNKSEVEEVYQRRGNDIYLVRLIYSTFGAGMTTDAYAEGGKALYYDEDGRMVIEGYDKLLPDIVYNIGAVADHILHIKGEDIHLTDIGAPREALRFEIRRSPWPPGQAYFFAIRAE